MHSDYCISILHSTYGIISLGLFPTTLLLCTVRVSNSHCTVCSFLRLSHDVLANFLAVLRHEILLTHMYLTLVTLSFSPEFPALALYPPVHTHTPYRISSQIFTTVRYFCSCFSHTVRASKTLKTKILHKEQTAFPLEKNSIY